MKHKSRKSKREASPSSSSGGRSSSDRSASVSACSGSTSSSAVAKRKRKEKRKRVASTKRNKREVSENSSSESAAKGKKKKKKIVKKADKKKKTPKPAKKRPKASKSSSSSSNAKEGVKAAHSRGELAKKAAAAAVNGGRVPVLVAPNIWTPAALWPGHPMPTPRAAETGHRNKTAGKEGHSESDSDSESSDNRRAKKAKKSKPVEDSAKKTDRRKAAQEALKESAARDIAAAAAVFAGCGVAEAQKKDKKPTREELIAARAEAEALRSQLQFEREVQQGVIMRLEDRLGFAGREMEKLRNRFKQAKEDEHAARTKQRAATNVAMRIKQGSLKRLERREAQIQGLEAQLVSRAAQITALTTAREELLSTVTRLKKKLSHRHKHEEEDNDTPMPHRTAGVGRSLLRKSNRHVKSPPKKVLEEQVEEQLPLAAAPASNAAMDASDAASVADGAAAEGEGPAVGQPKDEPESAHLAKLILIAPPSAEQLTPALRISFAEGHDLVVERKVTSFRQSGERLWFSRPSSRVSCDRCSMRVPQAAGCLLSDPSRSQFMQDKFLCGACSNAENEVLAQGVPSEAKSGAERSCTEDAQPAVAATDAASASRKAHEDASDFAAQLAATSARAASAVAAAAASEASEAAAPGANHASAASTPVPPEPQQPAGESVVVQADSGGNASAIDDQASPQQLAGKGVVVADSGGLAKATENQVPPQLQQHAREGAAVQADSGGLTEAIADQAPPQPQQLAGEGAAVQADSCGLAEAIADQAPPQPQQFVGEGVAVQADSCGLAKASDDQVLPQSQQPEERSAGEGVAVQADSGPSASASTLPTCEAAAPCVATAPVDAAATAPDAALAIAAATAAASVGDVPLQGHATATDGPEATASS